MSYMFYGAKVFNQNIGTWNFSSVKDISSILDNSGLTVETYNNTLNSLASSSTLPYGLTFGGNGLVYSPSGKTAHDTLCVEKGIVFDGDAFISTNVINKNVPFDFIVNAGSTFSLGDYTFPANQTLGYPPKQSYTLEKVPGTIPYTKLIFTVSGDRLPVVMDGPVKEIYYLTVQV